MATQPERLKARTKQIAIRIWLELLLETKNVPEARPKNLLAEANELLAIFAASLWTAREKGIAQSANVSMTRWLNDQMI